VVRQRSRAWAAGRGRFVVTGAAAAMALALPLVGCGDDDSRGPAAGSDTAAADAATTTTDAGAVATTTATEATDPTGGSSTTTATEATTGSTATSDGGAATATVVPGGGPVEACPATGLSGGFDYGPSFVALDGETGDRAWHVCWDVPGNFVVVGVSGSLVLVVAAHFDGGTEAAALDAATGAQVWHRDAGAGGFGTSAVTDGAVVYLSDQISATWALDAATGDELWRVDVAGQLALGTGHLVATERAGPRALQVHDLDPRSGELRWTTTVEGGVERAHTVAGAVLVTTADAVFRNYAVAALDADGRTVWTAPIGADPVGSELVAVAEHANGDGDGIVLVHDPERPSELVALVPRQGGELWRVDGVRPRAAGGGFGLLVEDGRVLAHDAFPGGAPSVWVDLYTGERTPLSGPAGDDSQIFDVTSELAVTGGLEVGVVELTTGVERWRSAVRPVSVANGYPVGAAVVEEGAAAGTVVVAMSNESGA
jgi:hypothetical protein